MLSDELLREFESIVTRWYPVARKAILFYETEEGRKATESITELRDVLDHFFAAAASPDPVTARYYLDSARDHLRSAAVEPLERAVEQRLARLQERRQSIRGRRRIAWFVLGLRPPSAATVDDAEELVKGYIREGRLLKARIETAAEAVDHFENAHRQLLKIESMSREPEFSSRRFALAMSIIVGVVCLVAGAFLGPVVSNRFFPSAGTGPPSSSSIPNAVPADQTPGSAKP